MAEKFLKILCVVLFITGIGVASSAIVLKGNADSTSDIISPMGDSVSIFSIIKENSDGQILSANRKIVYGYLPYWSIQDSKYLQVDKLTDIAYFGLYINADGSFKQYLDDGTTEQGYYNWYQNSEIQDIIRKAKISNVRFALTVISHEDEVSSRFLNCTSCWGTLRDNLFLEMDKVGIKDINLNFEYVDFIDKSMARKYTEFVGYMNREMDKKYGNSFVVSSAFADSLKKERISDVETLSKAADAIFIMAYDFHRPTSDKAGPVSPIGGIGVHAEYDIENMLNDYLAVSNPKKLILGVPYYGYNWVVEDRSKYANRIEGNDYIGYSVSQTYAKIMDLILEVSPVINWDELGQTPYFSYVSPETGSLRTVYFENQESLKIKYNLVKDNDMAGIGIWALGYDEGYQELWDLLGTELAN